MPQLLLPFILPGVTHINQLISVHSDEKTEEWTYFVGANPLYKHEKNDKRQFRMITAQLIESGMCRQIDIIKTFGVSKSSVIRAQNQYRAGGFKAFFEKQTGRRKGAILTPEVLLKAQGLLDSGLSKNEAADSLEINRDVVRKAIEDGRLKKNFQKSLQTQPLNPKGLI
jgi:DNA invertase Pin-like site-specific DNA recombinase